MIEQAKNQAKRDFAKGLGHNENPYPKNTPERAAWMLWKWAGFSLKNSKLT